MFPTKRMSLAACLTTALLYPFSAAATHVAVVSGQQIVMESAEGKAIQGKLKKDQESLMAPIQKVHEEIEKGEKSFAELQKKGQKLAEELQSGEKMLSQAAKDSKINALKDLEEEAKYKANDLQRLAEKRNNAVKTAEEKMKAKYNELMMPFNQKIETTIKKLAHKEKWDVVLMKEQCVYVGETVDKTDLVVAALDEEYNKEKSKESADKAKINSDKK